MCLSFDPTYVKAYLRRGTARKNLKKFSLAKADFLKVLELEPENKQAQTEIKNLSEVSFCYYCTTIMFFHTIMSIYLFIFYFWKAIFFMGLIIQI